MTGINYEIYKQKLSIEQFYATWKSEALNSLTNELKNHIYKKYLVKQKVFLRDGFKCQNLDCKTPNSALQFHHLKWQKNGGEHKERNGVTLCSACHKGFHKATKTLKFGNYIHLPPHIRGHAFKLQYPDEVNWKQVKARTKKFRKELKEYHGIVLDGKIIMMLMKFLYMRYDDIQKGL